MRQEKICAEPSDKHYGNCVPIKATILNPALLAGTHIFESNVVRQPSTHRAGWIGFHGTTKEHSMRIETEGLKAFKPLTCDEIDLLCKVAQDLNWSEQSANMVKLLWKDAAGFAKSRVVNFFSVSVSALEHTKTRGGQGKERVLKNLVAEILKNPHFKENAPHRTDVEAIGRKLWAGQDGTPVVYAVYLKGTNRIWRYHAQEAIQADGPIEKWRIAAKVEAPDFKDKDYLKNREDAGKFESAQLANRIGSQHFSAILPTQPPDTNAVSDAARSVLLLRGCADSAS